MDLMVAINKRKSIRAYRPDPVPREILVKVMEAATRAPSWADTQSWEFAIVGGQVIEELKGALSARVLQGAPIRSEIPFPTFPELYQARSRAQAVLRYERLGIRSDDLAARSEIRLRNAHFFGAPNGIFIYTDREIGPWSIFDCGLVAQNIMLAAMQYGLGTCPAAALVTQPDELRRILGIPESKLIVLGMPIGYPDWDHPVNNFRSLRESLDKVVTWHGF